MINIRQLSKNDHDQFVALVNRYVQEYINLETLMPVHFDPQIGQFYFNDVEKSDEPLIAFVAEEDDKLIGFCYGYIHVLSDWSKSYFNENYGEIYDIYVAPENRGAGLSKKMIDNFEKKR